MAIALGSGSTLVLGGARSGKSTYAERIVSDSGLDAIYVATAVAGDSEMAERIAIHRARRGGAWRTVEEPDRIEDVLRSECGEGRAVLVDCLTLWLSNLMAAGADLEARTASLVETAKAAPGLRVFVSNEVGLGVGRQTHPGGLGVQHDEHRLRRRRQRRVDGGGERVHQLRPARIGNVEGGAAMHAEVPLAGAYALGVLGRAARVIDADVLGALHRQGCRIAGEIDGIAAAARRLAADRAVAAHEGYRGARKHREPDGTAVAGT